jgi:hypothetical protein
MPEQDFLIMFKESFAYQVKHSCGCAPGVDGVKQ